MSKQWSRRAFVGGMTAAGLVGPRTVHAKGGKGAPDVVFILVDQLRAHALSLYGEVNIETPILDGLLLSGAHFPRSYSSNPVCAPARASLFSGQYAHRHGVTRNGIQLPLKTRTLSGAFSKAGYETGYIGKWHLDAVKERPGFVPEERRFEHAYWAAYNSAHYWKKSGYYRDTPTLIRPDPVDTWEPEYQVDLALEFMAQRRDRPFYLAVSFGPPHPPGAGDTHPWQDHVPAAFWDEIDPEALTFRGNVPAELTGRNGAAVEHMHGYYASILALENSLARLLDGVPDDALVVLTADHGEMGGSHGAFKKGSPYDEAVRVPLGFRWKNQIAPNTQIGVPVSSVDVMPTLLSLAGVKSPPRLHGVDLSDWLVGNTGPERDGVLIQGRMERKDAWRMMRTRTHIWSETVDGRDRRLYDTLEDPLQQNNLVKAPKSRELVEQMEGEMAQMLKRFKDKKTV
jgi:arylsulfatase A-like enzyme